MLKNVSSILAPAGINGHYFEDCNPAEMKGPYGNNATLAEQLWQVAEELVKPFLVSDTKS